MARFYPVSKPAVSLDPKSPRKKQKTRHSEKPPVEMSVGWVLGTQGVPPVPAGVAASSSQIPHAHPSVSLLQENGFEQNVSYFSLLDDQGKPGDLSLLSLFLFNAFSVCFPLILGLLDLAPELSEAAQVARIRLCRDEHAVPFLVVLPA